MPLLFILLACTADADGDGFAAEVDCAPDDASIFPGNPETCDAVDNDCDGVVDDGVTEWVFADLDGDGYGAGSVAVQACAGTAGFAVEGGDCDDDDAQVHPGADELCNDRDDDCNGATDEDPTDASTWYPDVDMDGFGAEAWPLVACEAPDFYGAAGGDCDDDDPQVNPDADEVCDEVDNNCDGEVDEDSALDATTWYEDADGDGHGDASVSTAACVRPEGTSRRSDDCDDSSSAVSPSVAEVCDGVDNDCDGQVDFDGWIPGDYADLAQVMEDAPDGAHICLPAGTYAAGGAILDGRSLTLEGEGSGVTTLDAQGSRLFETASGASLSLIGFTIEHAEGDYGAVVLAYDGGDLLLRDIVVQDAVTTDPNDVSAVILVDTLDSARLEEVVIDGLGFTSVEPSADLEGVIAVYDTPLSIDGLEIRNLALALPDNAEGLIQLLGSEAVLEGVYLHDNVIDCELAYGAVLAYELDSISVTGLRIVDNTWTTLYGGSTFGLKLEEVGSLTASNVEVSRNTIDSTLSNNLDGLALYLGSVGSSQVSNLLVADNRVSAKYHIYGAGLIAYVNGPLSLWNADFANNEVSAQGRIELLSGLVLAQDGDVVLGNVSVVGNSFTSTDTSCLATGFFTQDASVALYNNNVTDLPSGDVLVDQDDGTLSFGGFATSLDPLYTDPANGDYTLSSGSPMIDAGSSSVLDADGSISDVGAYGGPLGQSWN